MHYRNGREAQNGDKVIMLNGGHIAAVGVLYDAKSDGGDHCNGMMAPLLGGSTSYACLCDCLHVDDLAAILAEKGLDKRPPGK